MSTKKAYLRKFLKKIFFSKIFFFKNNFFMSWFFKKISIVLFFHCFMGHTHIGRTLENFWQKFFFSKIFFFKMIFFKCWFFKKNSIVPLFHVPHPKKNFFSQFLFFFKKKWFLKRNFFLGHALIHLTSEIFPIFVFLQKIFFVEKCFFSGSHPDRPYLFLMFFSTCGHPCPKCQ